MNTNSNLDNEIAAMVAEMKLEKGCLQVFVDTTYSQPRLFPIYNDAQVEFMKAIRERHEFARYDDLILELLETKESNYDELVRLYDVWGDAD